MAPELFTTMEANELRDLAQRIAEYQAAKKLSDNALLKKLPGLGSTKTYKRILADDLAELDLERQLNNYRAAWAYVESIDDTAREAEEIYEDLYNVVQLRRVFAETSRESGLARVIFLLGPSGSGKTMSQRWLLEKYGARLITVRACRAWGDAPNAMFAEILTTLGVRDLPGGAFERQKLVFHKLREVRRCLLIEDSHYLGPNCLSVIVTLIDETPGEVVLAAIDTIWRRLETKAYEECRQLTGNRISERIQLGRDVRAKDVEKILQRRLKWADPQTVAQVLGPLCDKANNYGRLAFVRETIKAAADKANGEPVTAEHFTTAMAEKVATR